MIRGQLEISDLGDHGFLGINGGENGVKKHGEGNIKNEGIEVETGRVFKRTHRGLNSFKS